MPRRSNKTSPGEDFVELVALLPWWGCLIVALVSFAWLNSLAARPLVASTQPGQLGTLLTGSLALALAGVGRVAVPLLCILAAALSAWRGHRRRALVDRVAESGEQSVLHSMTWAEFEVLVGEAYRREGYTVAERGGARPDGGVDLILRKDGGEYFVQCKQWKVFNVGVGVVRALKGVVSTHGARGGFVITSGRFTPDAIAFARKANIALVDGVALHALIRGVQAPRADPTIADREQGKRFHSEPACPLCRTVMARRTARRGRSVGSMFWGCTNYPECTGTRQMT